MAQLALGFKQKLFFAIVIAFSSPGARTGNLQDVEA
jgi:hypothetical protein